MKTRYLYLASVDNLIKIGTSVAPHRRVREVCSSSNRSPDVSGPPTRCTVEIIQVGISEIVSYPIKSIPSRWHEDLRLARALISEAGILYREVSL